VGHDELAVSGELAASTKKQMEPGTREQRAGCKRGLRDRGRGDLVFHRPLAGPGRRSPGTRFGADLGRRPAQTAATNFDQATISLYASCSPDPDACPSPPRSYFLAETIFDADRTNVTDPIADNLSAQLENDANNAITMESMAGSDVNVTEMVTAYQQLITRCGQLVQSQA
jgi:hypothetical protein